MEKQTIKIIAKGNAEFGRNFATLYDIRNNLFDATSYIFEGDEDLCAAEENVANNCLWEIVKVTGSNRQDVLDVVDRFFDDEIDELRG